MEISNELDHVLGKETICQFHVEDPYFWEEEGVSHEIRVLATHVLIEKWMEMTLVFFRGLLPMGVMPAICNFQIRHVAVTPAGSVVTLKIKLAERQGNHLFFALEAFDEFEQIATGSCERVLVSNEFLSRKMAVKK